MDWLIEFITERPAMFARIVAAFVLAFAGVMAKYFQNRLKKEEHYFSVRNQTQCIKKCDELDVRKMLQEMFMDTNEFVTLSASTPIHKISYVQACVFDEDMIEVQIGMEQLYHKYCTRGETLGIFFDFINEAFEPDLSSYTIVELKR